MRVEIEGQPPIEFPDGTDPAVIDAVVKRDFVKPEPPGVLGSAYDWIKAKMAGGPAPVDTVPAHEVPVRPEASMFNPMPGVTMEGLQEAAVSVPEAAAALGSAAKNLPLRIAKGIGSRAEMLGDIAGAMRVNPNLPEVDVTEQVGRAVGGLPVGDNLISKLGREAADTHGAILEAATPEFKSPIAKHVYNAALSAGETLSTLPANIIIPGASLMLMGTGSGAEEYHELVKQGVAKPVAAAGGAVNAGIEIVTEKLPLDYLTKSMGAPFKKYLIGMMVREVPAELAATAGQLAENAWATSKTLGEAAEKYKKAIGPSLLETAIQTPLSAGMQAGAVRGAVRAADLIQQMKAGKVEPTRTDENRPEPAPSAPVSAAAAPAGVPEWQGSGVVPAAAPGAAQEMQGGYAGPDRREPAGAGLRGMVQDYEVRAVAGDMDAVAHLRDAGVWGDNLSPLLNKRGYEKLKPVTDKQPEHFFLDLDNFKETNEKLTHAGGDQILTEIGTAIRGYLGEDVLSARWGGDEFAGSGPVGLREKLEALRNDFASAKIPIRLEAGMEYPKGSKQILKEPITIIQPGVKLSFGIGKTWQEAYNGNEANKEERKGAGLRYDRKDGPSDVGRTGSQPAVGGEVPAYPVAGGKPDVAADAEEGAEVTSPSAGAPASAPQADLSIANLRLNDYLKTLSLPDDFAARQEPLRKAAAEHRRAVMAEAEKLGGPEEISAEERRMLELSQAGFAKLAEEQDKQKSAVETILEKKSGAVEAAADRVEQAADRIEQTAADIVLEKKSGGITQSTAEPDTARAPKEPWQMGREEWFDSKNALRGNGAYSTLRGGSSAQSRSDRLEAFNYGVKPRWDEDLNSFTEPDHKDVIKKALAEGKPVPAEVLKDYPDLNLPDSFRKGSAELHSFPGPLGRWMRKLFGVNDEGQMKWVERAFDRMGEHVGPEWKNQVGRFFRTPAFYVEEYPEAEPLFERSLTRGENNHRDNRFVFDKDEEGGYSGIAPVLALSRAEVKDLSRILVKGDREKARYATEQLKQRFNASDPVIEAYMAARDMVERLQSVIIEKRKEIALSPYEVDRQLHDKLSRVMNDLVEITDAQERKKYLDRILRDEASVLDHQTKVALNRVGLHVDGIHEDISRFEENPGYVPRVREEGAFHVRAIEHVLSQDEHNAVFGAIMYGIKARAEYSPEQLKAKFKIEGKAEEAYKDALEKMKGHPVLSRSVKTDDDIRKSVGKIVGRLATREVWMAPVNTYAAGKALKAKVAADPKKYFPENYNPKGKYEITDPVENKKLSEEVYADIGNPAAREAIIERAVLRAEAKGAISVSDAEAITDQILGAMTEEQLKRGAGKSFLQRSKNLIEGYETEDLDKVLTSHVTGMVGYLNKALFSVRALRDMEGIKDPNVQRWANKYYKNSLKNSGKLDGVIGKARGAAVFYRLGGVVKTMIQNSFQQYQTGWSEMARYAKDPGALLAAAQKDVLGRNLTDFDKKVLEEAIDSGQADAKYMREIAGANDRAPERGFTKLVDLSMKGFGWVESEMNRKPALLAAMRLFTGQRKADGSYYGVGREGKPYGLSYDEAMRKAKKFVRATHYEISRANEPEIVQDMGPLARGAYTFQSYTANQLNWIFNRARHGEARVLGRFMLVTWALGGLAAAPFLDEIDEGLAKYFGVSLKHKLRQAIREGLKYGREIEDLVMNGIPAALLGLDLSRSVQLNTPLPIQVLLGTDKSLEERASGAIGGLVVSAGRAVDAAGKGDMWRAAEYASPNAVGNIMRGVRLYQEGATTGSGKPITDEEGRQLKMSGGEAVSRGLGFQPLRMSKYQDANRLQRNIREYWGGRRDALLDAYRLSKGDADRRKKVNDDIDAFNTDLRADKEARLIVDLITGPSKVNAILNRPGMKKVKENQFKREVVR